MISQHPGQVVATLADLIVEVLPENTAENIEKWPDPRDIAPPLARGSCSKATCRDQT